MAPDPHHDVEAAVRKRYSEGAQAREAALCCPVDYDPKYLKVLPKEILERDYGCGDPSRFVREGDTVLDLGSGGGKICYIAAQIAGPKGRVIGVDMNDEMLALANKYRDELSRRPGWSPVEFRKGKIQDLRLDYGKLENHLREHPVENANDFLHLEGLCETLRRKEPMIPDGSVDLILSNCVLNLVRDGDKRQLFSEMHRVLKRGGRAAISDIVSDEDVPAHLRADPELWSGCISGAFREDRFLKAFEEAGFYGIELAKRDEKPWRVVEGIEFRSVTVLAWKGREGPCLDHKEAVIYKGPWREVRDDDGHVLRRGERMAVCRKTFDLYTREPYAQDIVPVPPRETVEPKDAKPFDCLRDANRTPRETKGAGYHETTPGAGDCCSPGEKCC